MDWWSELCPHALSLRVVVILAGFDLTIAPWPVLLSTTTASPMYVKLQTRPASGSSVLVSVDSTSGMGSFLLSACALTFNATNWNVTQVVHIVPVLSAVWNKREKVRACGAGCPSPVCVPSLSYGHGGPCCFHACHKRVTQQRIVFLLCVM